jgi:hypothetical protein
MARIKCITMQLGVMYDSQAKNRKLGGLSVRAPSPCRTPIGHLGVIYDSQQVGIHKITTANRWKPLLFD